ncbi:heparin lyase I family protein [Ascidiaceihabitans sp.]|uniref:heparin lyase I family protein n=1 Tax=Ascidiaceihabitans sp. TaxID=1872644 RepID=UPI003298E413
MKRLYVLALVVFGLASPSLAENYRVPNSVMAQVSSVLGEDMIATQRLPHDTSMQVLSQAGVPFVRFTVLDGDIGGAPTDNDPAHGRAFDRPYSERAEVRMDGTMRRNSIYEITFEARFGEGFQGEAETFFQIHTGQKPPLMFFFREFGRTHLLANLMQGCQSTCGHNDQPEYSPHKTTYPRSAMFGRWHQFRLVIDTSNQGSMSIFFNGMPLIQNQPVTFPTQHKPYVRLGIYRAGDLSGNATSVVDYRALAITRVGSAG